MTQRNYTAEITEFGNHYGYDVSYMHEILKSSPDGYQKFSDFIPLASHKDHLDLETHWIVRLTTLQFADCGTCLELGIKMALEDNVSKELIKATLQGGKSLTKDQLNLYLYTRAIAACEQVSPDLQIIINGQFNSAQLLEIGILIGATKVFPAIKRASGHIVSCSLITNTLDDLL